MSYTDVARHLGITTGALGGLKLPPPDANIGATRGWKFKTIEKWNKARPGRGVGGGRPKNPT
jgi:hypothetical protein